MPRNITQGGPRGNAEHRAGCSDSVSLCLLSESLIRAMQIPAASNWLNPRASLRLLLLPAIWGLFAPLLGWGRSKPIPLTELEGGFSSLLLLSPVDAPIF